MTVKDKIEVEINSLMGPTYEMIVPGDLEGFYNVFSFIWSVEGKTYKSICGN